MTDKPDTAVEPVPVSPLRDGILSADDRIDVGGVSVLRFHPLNRKVKDGTPRCIACGQIDEDGYHEAEFCPGVGGWLPFPTSTIKIKLRADNGYGCEVSARITLEQWVLIDRIIAGEGCLQREIVDQDKNVVGTARTPLKELVHLESHTDANGTTWTPPTAYAYFAVCKALEKKDARICELLAQGTEARRAETETGSVHDGSVGPADAPNQEQGDGRR